MTSQNVSIAAYRLQQIRALARHKSGAFTGQVARQQRRWGQTKLHHQVFVICTIVASLVSFVASWQSQPQEKPLMQASKR